MIVCLAGLTGLVGCAPAAPPGPPPARAATGTPGQQATASAPAPAAPAAESKSDAALRLEALMGQHAILAGDLMRGRLRNDEDFAQAANAAVGQNTDDLAGLVGALSDDQQASRFRGLWADHVTALFNYARGLATEDNPVREDAKAKLTATTNDLGDLFATASQGRLGRDAARAAVQAHVDPLTRQADAYAARDYTGANTAYRQAYKQTFDLGNTVATSLLPPGAAADLGTPGWKLRSEMTRLLGEHVGLALGTLRSGATGNADFPAAIVALNGNTTDVTAAVDSLFGGPAAAQFMSLWADHLDLVGGYAADVGAQKPNRREAVQGELRDWGKRFAAFIDTATGGRVPASDLTAAFLGLDDLLLRQVDAFAAKDYQQAQQLANQTYPQVFGLARNMADAFGATLAARMPRGGAETGGGGTAPATGS